MNDELNSGLGGQTNAPQTKYPIDISERLTTVAANLSMIQTRSNNMKYVGSFTRKMVPVGMALVAAALTISVQAQTQQGKAIVMGITGLARPVGRDADG